jgi:FdhD protein
VNNAPFGRIREMPVRRLHGAAESEDHDFLAAEEPLEIRVEGHSVAVVMRTPGEDQELAAGFLVTEGLVRAASDVLEISHQAHCWFPARRGQDQPAPTNGRSRPSRRFGPKVGMTGGNVVDVRLRSPESMDLKKLTRHVFTSSSCGICSKASIEAVRQQFPGIADACEAEATVLWKLPRLLEAAQETFRWTGGLHACALFDLTGRLLVLREDVGRHNALDKVVGWALLQHRLPLQGQILLLSGRASFEMLQKALAAGIPIVAAVSAPSSLAAEFARQSGQTLVGFLRGERMNIYAGAQRVRGQMRREDASQITAGSI